MGRLHNKYLISLFLQILLILAVINTVTAAQEATDKDKKTAQSKATADTTAAKGSEARDYIYDPSGKTDPFQSFVAAREEQEKTRAKTYLETLELSQLDLVVIVIGPKGKWAMVKDSKGVGHVIKEGTPIGTNNGVVYKITQGEVIIREEYKDFRGQSQYRDISKVSQPQM
jgi:type IV pilus assembly protein PilP